jgi:hypothetical protein
MGTVDGTSSPTGGAGPHTTPSGQGAQAPQQASRSPLRILRVVAGAALIIALISAGFSVYEVTKPTAATRGQFDALDHRVSALRSELVTDSSTIKNDGGTISTLSGEVSSLQDSTTAGQVTGLKSTVAGLRATVSKLSNCIPQVQTEIGGLSITWSINGNNASSDSFNIDNPTIISNDCSRVLYGG